MSNFPKFFLLITRFHQDKKWHNRSRRSEVFSKKGVLGNFEKIHRKPPVLESLFFNKVAGLRTLTQVFSCEFCQISKNTFSYRTPPVAASNTTLAIILWQFSVFQYRFDSQQVKQVLISSIIFPWYIRLCMQVTSQVDEWLQT